MVFEATCEHDNIYDDLKFTRIFCLLWIELIDGFLLEYNGLLMYCMILTLDDDPCMSRYLSDLLCTKMRQIYHDLSDPPWLGLIVGPVMQANMSCSLMMWIVVMNPSQEDVD